jgi:hypothetical protein
LLNQSPQCLREREEAAIDVLMEQRVKTPIDKQTEDQDQAREERERGLTNQTSKRFHARSSGSSNM